MRTVSSLIRSITAKIFCRPALLLVANLWFCTGQGNADPLVKRPEGADGGPTTVYVSVFFLDIDSVNSANQTFTANVSYEYRWIDPRLAHAEDGNKVLPIVDVWHPRIQVANRQLNFLTFPEIVHVSPAGEVSYQQRVWGHFSQPLDLRDFPFDSQKLQFDMVSAGYSPEELVLLPDPDNASGIADELSLPDWDIASVTADSMVHQPNAAAGALAGFRFAIEADRQAGYYIFKVILPLLLIVAMSWIVFWIDPKEGGTQISVSVTSMLTLIAYRFMVGGLLPHISYLTRLDAFILVSTVLVFTALMLVVITSRFAKTDRLETARRVDRIARVAFPAIFLVVVGFAFIL